MNKNSKSSDKFTPEKMSQLQENLKFACETISSLQKETKRLKSFQHIQTSDSPSSLKKTSKEKRKKQALKEELVNLRSLLYQKDKAIESLSRKIKDHHKDKEELHSLSEANSKLVSELAQKEGLLVSFDAKLKSFEKLEQEHKRVLDLNNDLKLELREASIEIEKICKGRVDWRDVIDYMDSVLVNHFSAFKGLESGKNHSDIFMSRLAYLKTQLSDLSKSCEEIETSRLKGIKQAEEANKKLQKELNLLSQSQFDSNTLAEIQESSIELIDLIHSNYWLNKLFKKNFICTKSFQNLIDRRQFDEGLLKSLKLINSVLNDEKFLSLSYKESKKQAKNHTRFNTLPQSKYLEVLSDQDSIKNNWTQTTEISPKSMPKNKSLQVFASNTLNKSIQAASKPPNSVLQSESQELLQILDKQNSRLAQLNSRISNIVPGQNEADLNSNSSYEIESSESDFKSYCRVPRLKNKNWFKDSSIIVHSQSAKSLKKNSKGCQFRDSDSITTRSPPKAYPFESKPVEETRHTRADSLAEKGSLADYSLMSFNASPRNEIKRGTWKVPSGECRFDRKKRIHLSPKEKRIVKKSKSPEERNDKYKDYSRPVMKGEDRWTNVNEYFSLSADETKQNK